MDENLNLLEQAPLRNAEHDTVVDSFEELYERVMSVTTPRQEFTMTKLN